MTVTQSRPRSAPQPPRWLIRLIWMLHRAAFSLTGGRFGLRSADERQWGMLRLTTTGRRSGKRRVAILGFIEDGANLVSPAMNGWGEAEPAWWLNLQANPDAVLELPDGSTRAVTARPAIGDERERLWRRLVDLGTAAYTDEKAALRSRETAIVILEPSGAAT